MTTQLATSPVEEPDLLSLIADPWASPFGLALSAASRFRDACEAEAGIHDGWVNPSAVRARLLGPDGTLDIDPRRYSALWSTACARGGYMVKTDVPVPITGRGSRGNTNKSTVWRRWVG
jgi:hypothetical protein